MIKSYCVFIFAKNYEQKNTNYKEYKIQILQCHKIMITTHKIIIKLKYIKTIIDFFYVFNGKQA